MVLISQSFWKLVRDRKFKARERQRTHVRKMPMSKRITESKQPDRSKSGAFTWLSLRCVFFVCICIHVCSAICFLTMLPIQIRSPTQYQTKHAHGKWCKWCKWAEESHMHQLCLWAHNYRALCMWITRQRIRNQMHYGAKTPKLQKLKDQPNSRVCLNTAQTYSLK